MFSEAIRKSSSVRKVVNDSKAMDEKIGEQESLV